MSTHILELLLVLSIICVIGGIIYNLNTIRCPTMKVVYKYVPKTLEQEYSDPNYPSEIFYDMFNKPSTWIGGINDLDLGKKREKINDFFISQN